MPHQVPRRLVSLDALRGLSIAAVLVLHSLQYTVDESVLEDNIQYSLPLYYVGGMSGMFFILSGLGNALAISNRLQQPSNKPVNLSRKRQAQKQACCRGLTLMLIGYATQIVVFRMWEDSFLMHYNRGQLTTKMATSEQVSWIFTDRLTRNFILESIGFVGIFTSFVAIEVVDRRSRGGCAQSTVTRAMAIIVTGILILNPLLRLALDSATCCVPESCSMYPSIDGTRTLASPPEIILPPNGTCAAMMNYNPCQFAASDETAFINGTSVGTSFVRSDINTTTLTLRKTACEKVRKEFQDSTIALHGVALGRIGRRWCTVEVGRGSVNATLAAQVCRMKPWWGRGTDFGREELKATGVGGAIVVSLLQLFFGRFAFFSYAAPGLVGTSIGLYMERPERFVSLHSTGSSSSSRRRRRRKSGSHIIEPVLPWSCVRRSLLCCFASFLLGFLIFMWLVVERADDAAMQAGTHIRLFVGGGEIAIVLCCLSLVDLNGDHSWYNYIRDQCRCLRRCGAMTLTLWTLQWLNLVVVIILDEIGGKKAPWKSRANGERTYTWNVLVVFVLVAPLWWLLTIGYEKIKFVGSMEWIVGKLIFQKKGNSKSGDRMIEVLDSCMPMYGEDDFFFGRATNCEDSTGDVRPKTTCCQLCFCCCCQWQEQMPVVDVEGGGRGGGGGAVHVVVRGEEDDSNFELSVNL